MPRFMVYLSPQIEVALEVEATSAEQAEKVWKLHEAKLAVAEEVKDLFEDEFNINDVQELSETEND